MNSTKGAVKLMNNSNNKLNSKINWFFNLKPNAHRRLNGYTFIHNFALVKNLRVRYGTEKCIGPIRLRSWV